MTSFPVTFERDVSAESDSEPRRAERASQPAEPRRASVSSASADVDGGSSASSIVDDSDDGDVALDASGQVYVTRGGRRSKPAVRYSP